MKGSGGNRRRRDEVTNILSQSVTEIFRNRHPVALSKPTGQSFFDILFILTQR
jgi:hypothetical protein